MSSPPSTLGQYQIIREIARSNDIVYEAYDPLMNRRVAIKELAIPPGLSPQQREERINRFKREAQAAGSLNHPHIMTVFSFAEDQGRQFMAMEYLDGHTLRNEIDTKGFLANDRAIEIAVAVLEGLAHAHDKGVIHRDIKPDNIQILSNGAIKITDFGIARLTFQPNLTVDGQVFGTPSYMSPEQVVGKDIDRRSDLFSVGVVLFEMLSGQKPFTGDNVMAISYAILNKEPSQPATIDDRIWRVIRKALEKAPSVRYQDAQEFIDDLKGSFQSAVAPEPAIYTTPYGTFPNPAYQPSTPSYPYNPFGQQTAGVPPPVVAPPAAFPPPQANPYYTQAPIYYPPPPRQPLLKEEQRIFLKKLFATIVLVGTLYLVIVVGMNGLMQAVQRWQGKYQDGALVQTIDQRSKGARQRTVEEVFVSQQPDIDKLVKTNDMPNAKQRMAIWMEDLGQRAARESEMQGDESAKRSKLSTAESCFLDAIKLDPNIAAYYTDMASLYQRYYVLAKDDASKMSMSYSVAYYWSQAASRETDNKKVTSEATAAAQWTSEYLRLALLYPDSVDRAASHSLVQSVEWYLPKTSPYRSYFDNALSSLGY